MAVVKFDKRVRCSDKEQVLRVNAWKHAVLKNACWVIANGCDWSLLSAAYVYPITVSR